jgi:TRAP-type mannitol/chloroaromatic compound transport system permease small subunit
MNHSMKEDVEKSRELFRLFPFGQNIIWLVYSQIASLYKTGELTDDPRNHTR